MVGDGRREMSFRHDLMGPMTRSLYVASPSGQAGKSMIAFGLVDLFSRRVATVGVFRPVTTDRDRTDTVLSLLISHDGVTTSYEDAVGVTYAEVHADPDAALSTIVERYRAVAAECEVTIIVGSDYTGVSSPTELAWNATIAANLGAPVVLVVPALGQDQHTVAQTAELAAAEIGHGHAQLAAVVLNRCAEDTAPIREAVREALDDGVGRLGSAPTVPVWAIPEIPILAAPTVAQIATELGAEQIFGDPDLMTREAEHMLVAGMSVEHVLERLTDGQLVIAAGDRPELLVALLAAHRSAVHPSLAGVVLNGGFLPSPQIASLARGLDAQLPVLATGLGTFETASIVARTRGVISAATQRKVDLTLGVLGQHLPAEEALALVDVPGGDIVTPLMFEATLVDRARADLRHIVLPEGDDDRVLRAASTLLARRVADLTILGEEQAIHQRATELGLDISAARIINPNSSALLDEFAEEFARVRHHKGMTVERAREIVTDVSHFGTLLVHTGRADGMVSGAAHTTAHTIRPALQIIRTAPGTAIVSSVFLMCLADRVLVYGDCAVNPDPNAHELADIAISSAATAARFGINPRIAMLSYSTGDSGSGAEVEEVRAATALVRQLRPDLLVEGPLQYDAAVEPSVARTKLPDSPVAGQATVLVFPDLNTGNNTYKAVQRSAGAVAIGPVLQGLNRPVNDLSRGATVTDIVNTVVITAIQAQEQS